ncbi:MAG: hypothetical protein QM757_29045 [Paludibaculum sp.]
MQSMVNSYLINSPTLVVIVQGSERTPITIPSASIIDVPQELDGLHGLIEVQFNGESVLMFAEDIRQRGKRVSKATASQ